MSHDVEATWLVVLASCFTLAVATLLLQWGWWP